MTAEDIKKHYKTVAAAVAALPKPVTRDAFYKWEKDGVPLLRQYQYQEITEGVLTVDN